MGKLLGLEILLMLATGLFAMWVIPALLGYPPAWTLLLVGLMMAMSFIGLYAMANLGGRKMGGTVRVAIGLVAYVAAFWGDLALVAANLYRGDTLPAVATYIRLAPALLGLLLLAAATVKARSGERGEVAGWALYAYALPMLGVRYLLVPLVAVNPVAQLMAMQAGAFYLFLRGLARLFMPTSAEGNEEAGPLIDRPVPDRIVGLVEGTTRRSARPFATRPDGSLDESAVSILCRPEDLPGVAARLREALGELPFTVQPGLEVEGKVELVIRPARAGELVQS
ncbi:MAG: hypothetical protein ACOY94_26875 [Bacillota bacterium]